MSKSEFLLLIPGIIYGVGVVDLIKVTFRKHYWEIYLWAIILFLVLILQWYSLFYAMDQIGESKLSFTFMMITPLVFTRGCYILTPTENAETKSYFIKYRSAFFINLVFMILANGASQYFLVEESDPRALARLVFLPLILAAAYWDNQWYRLAIALLFFIVYAQFFTTS
jgi:hypothetical protein